MSDSEVQLTPEQQLRRRMAVRPAVHRLCYGAFLQGYLFLDERTLIVPLAPMGFGHVADYTARYHGEMFGISPEPQAINGFVEQGKHALPVLALIRFTEERVDVARMEAEALAPLDRAEQIVSWISGDNLTEFAYVTATEKLVYFRAIPPHSNNRLLLGPGNVGSALASSVKRIRDAADGDERFAFALSLYRDALHERDAKFKIARLFSVLEGLAYALISSEMPSRKAVRHMLGLDDGATAEVNYEGKKVRYERIELAGRLRDRLFHGVPFERDALSAEWRQGFDLLSERPDKIISALKADCELEFARWGNNASKARTAAETRRAKKLSDSAKPT